MALKGHTDKDRQGWLHCKDTSCEFTLVQPIVQTATASCLRGERPSDCMVITVFAPEDYKWNARGSCIFSLQKLDKGSRVVMIALKLSWPVLPVLVKDLKATIHGVHSDGPNIFPSSSILY